MCDTAECRQARLLAGGQITDMDDLCALYGVPLDRCRAENAAAATHNTAAVTATTPRSTMPHTPTTAGDRPRRPDEDVVDWAVETGRVSARTAPDWRASIRAGVTKPETIEGLASCMVPGVGPAGSLPSANAGRQVSAAVDAIGRPGASRAHARNPLVDAARAAAPGMTVRAAAAATSTPTLFSTGDLPAFTASGIDPNLLLQVPWQARHAMAAATSTQAAYAILAECTGPDGPDAAELNYSGDDGNRQYAKRVEQWVGAAMTDEENYTSLFGEEA